MFFGTVEKPPRLSEFDLEVPEKCIGQHPAKKRDECKLMILDKKDGNIQHKKFKDITSLFNKGDVLVLNNTKVFSILSNKADGIAIPSEILVFPSFSLIIIFSKSVFWSISLFNCSDFAESSKNKCFLFFAFIPNNICFVLSRSDSI